MYTCMYICSMHVFVAMYIHARRYKSVPRVCIHLLFHCSHNTFVAIDVYAHCIVCIDYRGYADPPTSGQKGVWSHKNSWKRGVVTYVRHFALAKCRF